MAQATAVIATADNADLGTILTDTSGRTLYLFTKDAPGIWPNPNIHAMKCNRIGSAGPGSGGSQLARDLIAGRSGQSGAPAVPPTLSTLHFMSGC
jgi:hypothetical protein